MSRKLLQKIFRSTWFSIIVLAILIGALITVAHSVIQSYQVVPDFGGMVTIRQSDTDGDSTSLDRIILTTGMIQQYITAEKNLLPVAAQYGWDIPYEKMVKQIEIQQKITAKNCFVISVNTGNLSRSRDIAEALTRKFIESYRQQWERINRQNLINCKKRVVAFENELKELLKVQQNLKFAVEVRAVKNDIELQALNEQLVAAQSNFFTAYCGYVSGLADKYNETKMELDIALKVSTPEDPKVKALSVYLDAMKNTIENFEKELNRQNPDVYSMKITPEKLYNMPPHVSFLYDNIQRLQQLKLSMLLPSIIQNKQQLLEAEQRKKSTLEHLLNSNSCDVFIREIGK